LLDCVKELAKEAVVCVGLGIFDPPAGLACEAIAILQARKCKKDCKETFPKGPNDPE
jgi:hypothetical protein